MSNIAVIKNTSEVENNKTCDNYFKGVNNIKFIKFKLIKIFLPLILMSISLVFLTIGGMLSQKEKSVEQMLYLKEEYENSFTTFSKDTEVYRETVTELCKGLKVETQYINNILGIIEVSTKGLGSDPMSASDKMYNKQYPKVTDGIINPIYSIKVGVQEFKDLLLQFNIKDNKDDNLINLYNEYHKDSVFGEIIDTNFGATVHSIIKNMVTVDKEFIYPLKDYHNISSPYGQRENPIYGGAGFHTGTDFPAPKGTEVMASNNGIVTKIGYEANGFGNYIIVKHGGRYESLYPHLTVIGTQVGNTVVKGEIIGGVGSTGYSTGNHLHFEIRIDGKHTDPIPYLKGEFTIE